MSRKGNCMDNGAMENFFGRLKVEMFYGEKFETVDEFVHRLREYIYYWNNERISLKLKGMSPVQYRTHADETMVIPLKFGRSHYRMTPPTPIDQ